MSGHKRRQKFLLKAYPNCPTHRPQELPRKGSRGAWMSNPHNIEDLGQLEGTNIAREAWFKEREEKVDELLEKIPEKDVDGDEMMDIFEEHLRVTQALKAARPTAETFKKQHIEMLARKPPENPIYEGHKKTRSNPEVDLMPTPEPSSPSKPISGRQRRREARSAEARAQEAELDGMPDDHAKQHELAPLRNLKTTLLADVWAEHGAEWVEMQDCIVPCKFQASTLEAYETARASAVLTDASYRNLLVLEGEDREVAGDHFVSANLRKMRTGDAQYACILDSKGFVLDTCFVLKTEERILLLTEGAHGVQLMNYLGDYIGFARQSGLDVVIRPEDATVLELCGPKAQDMLEAGSPAWPFPEKWKTSMPQMSFLRMEKEERGFGGSLVMRSTLSGLADGFIYICTPPRARNIADELVEKVPLAGTHCMDILRMEGGHPRGGMDISPGLWSPVRTSLAWTIDQSKLRNHLIFGHEKIFNHLGKGPTYRRVGFFSDAYVHGGCRILANPSRQPIGIVTSSVWSPRFKKRICQGYVKPEYAKKETDVLFNVLYDLPLDRMAPRRIKYWIRQGDLRSAYRRLVPGRVSSLPFIPHRERRKRECDDGREEPQRDK